MGAYDYKTRTKFGRWADKNKISQQKIIDIAGINKNTVSRLFNDVNYDPYEETQLKVVGRLRRYGYDVSVADFW